MQEQYYIRHTLADVGSSMGFWKLGGGYTTDVNQAEKFSRNEAIAQYQVRAEDQPILCSLIEKAGYKAIDCQLIGMSRDRNQEPGYVIQINGCFDGNNIKFLSKNGGYTYNYDNAKVIHGEYEINSSHTLHSKDILDQIARTVINRNSINIDEAFSKMGIEKRKIQRVIRSNKKRGNCLSCGRIVWNENPYVDPVCRMCD